MARRFDAIALVLVALLFACSSSKEADDEPLPAADQILRSAEDAISELNSFHFQLEHENGTSALPLGLRLLSAEGDVASPDRLKAKVRARSGSLVVDVDIVSVGSRTWLKNPFTRQFQELPDTSLQDITNPLALIQVLTRDLRKAEVEGREKVDGVDVYHVTGTIDSAALGAVLPVEPGHSVAIDLYIGEDDSLPRRVDFDGPLTSSDANDIRRRVDFSRFNQTVEITAPR